jgi:pSer/pThr/pTyr-binding forkhead associated (FHA) protein
MNEMVIQLPVLAFVLATDDQGITTLDKAAKVQKTPPDIVVMLRVLEGPDAGKSFQIYETPATIGRDKICTISIKDSRMSRQHAAIFYYAPDFFLKDLASTNGTFLEDKQVKQARLKNGDKIRMGQTLFEFIVSKLSEAK